MSELTVQQRKERGHRAAVLLEDETLAEAIRAGRERIVAQWVAEQNAQKRENLWGEARALEAVKVELRRLVADGQIAAAGGA